MDDFDKKELGRLKDFERRVSDALDWLGAAINVTYAALLLGAPILVYLSPIKEDRTLQTVCLFLILLFTFGIGKADKAIGLVKK